MVEVRFVCIPSVEGVRCTLDGVVKYSVAGFASFFDVAQGEHTYSVEKAGMYVVKGEDPFKRPLGASGTTVIEWVPNPDFPWPEDEPWLMYLTFEVGEAPSKISDILGKVGSLLASIGFVGIIADSARKR
ncbi:hypothetical protein ES703_112329 [subsurface metagenome]